MRSNQRDQDAQDLALLLSLVPDPFALRADLSSAERGWFRQIQTRLALDAEHHLDHLSAAELASARAANRLILA